MSREARKEESLLQINALEEPSIQHAIQLFTEIASSSCGPNGKVQMIQNSVGGHLTLTSSSCRLLNAMSFSNPLIRLVVAAAQSHLSQFSDGGFFFIIFCLNLVKKSVDLQISNRCLIELNDEFLSLAIDILNCKDPTISCELQISNIKHMSCLARSVLQSKPLCGLYGQSSDMMVSLLLQTFLTSLPEPGIDSSQSDGIYIVCLEGGQSSESTVYPGLLVQFPEFPPYLNKELILMRTEENNLSVAIVTVSMSGDTEEILDANYQMKYGIEPESVVLGKMFEFCDFLAAEQIGVLFCQKVVHPKVKRYLKSKGILVVERLGLQLVNYVIDLTAAKSLTSFSRPNKSNFGTLENLEHQVLNEKSYFHLTSVNNRVCTLVLCSPQQENVSELKAVCQTAITTLRNALMNPTVLAGGGCWEISLAHHLRKKVFEDKDHLMDKMGCSYSVLQAACNAFTCSLETVAMSTGEEGDIHMTSNIIPHHWKLRNLASNSSDGGMCSCGTFSQKLTNLHLINESKSQYGFDNIDQSKSSGNLKDKIELTNTIVDLAVCSQNALKMAVYTANHILGIGQFIQDVN